MCLDISLLVHNCLGDFGLNVSSQLIELKVGFFKVGPPGSQDHIQLTEARLGKGRQWTARGHLVEHKSETANY